MWDPPGPGIKPVSPALAGGFLTTVPPGKSLQVSVLDMVFFYLQMVLPKLICKGALFNLGLKVSAYELNISKSQKCNRK